VLGPASLTPLEAPPSIERLKLGPPPLVNVADEPLPLAVPPERDVELVVWLPKTVCGG
jgi:hypothetical protein